MTLRAVVFDFDGLIVDSESASYRAWQEEYRRYGLELALDRWQDAVGTVGGFDALADLAAAVGHRFDRDGTATRRRDRWYELTRAERLRPGVAALVDDLRAADLALAVASSSLRAWVLDHLDHQGLADAFPVVVGRDDVGGRPKPAPDVYQEALRRLGVRPDEAVALEDSQHGVRAAVAAGLTVIAVPNPVTATSDLGAAHRVVPSLEGLYASDLRPPTTNPPATTSIDRTTEMPERTLQLRNATGLHARPAKVFASTAAQVDYPVLIAKGGREVNAKSVLSVLTLDANQGDEVTIRVEGADSDGVLGRLTELIENGFDELEDA